MVESAISRLLFRFVFLTAAFWVIARLEDFPFYASHVMNIFAVRTLHACLFHRVRAESFQSSFGSNVERGILKLAAEHIRKLRSAH